MSSRGKQSWAWEMSAHHYCQHVRRSIPNCKAEKRRLSRWWLMHKNWGLHLAPIRGKIGLKVILCSFLQLRVEWGFQRPKPEHWEGTFMGKAQKTKIFTDHVTPAQVHVIIYLKIWSKALTDLSAAARQKKPCPGGGGVVHSMSLGHVNPVQKWAQLWIWFCTCSSVVLRWHVKD